TNIAAASPKVFAYSDSVSWLAATVRSKPSKLVSRRPLDLISEITRDRANSATSRPDAASMPPTKQPMLPAPATPIGLSAIISHSIQCDRDFVSRVLQAALRRAAL